MASVAIATAFFCMGFDDVFGDAQACSGRRTRRLGGEMTPLEIHGVRSYYARTSATDIAPTASTRVAG